MKTKLLALALGTAVSLSAVAGPVESLPGGPLYMKFNGAEQIAVAGTTYSADPSKQEISWGVFTVSNIDKGVVMTPHQQIGDYGTGFFSNVSSANAQITGMFYGIQAGTNPTAADPFPGTNGFVDLYWRDLSIFSASINPLATPAVRTGFSSATGYTDGTFLGRLVFASGVDNVTPGNYLAGTQIPSSAGFSGISTAYLNIDTSAGGVWANQLNTDYFNTLFGTRDFRFKNSYQERTSWDDFSNQDNVIFGATLDDPAQAVALPEPGILSLMGLALVGMGAVRRRRQK
jgi:hypothetical protein